MKPRKLQKSTVKHIYGFNSLKSGEHFRVESGNEFFACYLLEYLKSASSFAAQPLGYKYQEHRREAKYTPDFELTDHNNNKKLLEIKPETQANSRLFQETFECKQAEAEKRGTPLGLLTDKAIKKEPLLRNLRLLYKYQTDTGLTTQHCQILETVESCQLLTVKEVCKILAISKAEGYPQIYDLLARGALVAVESLEEAPLTSNTLIRKSS